MAQELPTEFRSNNIVVSISGGCLTGVFTDIPNTNVVILDWDILEDENEKEYQGGPIQAKPFSLNEMPGDILQACQELGFRQ